MSEAVFLVVTLINGHFIIATIDDVKLLEEQSMARKKKEEIEPIEAEPVKIKFVAPKVEKAAVNDPPELSPIDLRMAKIRKNLPKIDSLARKDRKLRQLI